MKQYNNFGGDDNILTDKDSSTIAVLPVPFDQTSTWIKGTDKGPLAIIEASSALELYDIETDSEVYKRGIYTDPLLECGVIPEEMVRAVCKRVTDLLDDGKFVVTLGGEHSVAVGAAKAHADQYGNVTVLQLDAHADLRQEYEGSKYNHACVMSRIKEFSPVVQVGIRSMDAGEKIFIEDEKVFFAGDIAGRSGWAPEVIEALTDNVYLTVDLDVFDPSIMPSTGTPEPGGLLWYEVLGLLQLISVKKNIVGFDIVELCPNSKNKSPDFLAAKLIYKLLSYVFIDRP